MYDRRSTDLSGLPAKPRRKIRKLFEDLTFRACSTMLVVTLCASHSTAQEMKKSTLERVKQATVLVFTAISERERGDKPVGSGSGFFINSTGLFMTNNHVVDPSHGRSDREKQSMHYKAGRLTWSVVTDAGTADEQTFDAVVLYQNEKADQALAQAYDDEGHKLQTRHYLRFLPESRLARRTKVWGLGFPGGDRQRTSRDKHPKVSITKGHVLDVPRTPGGRIRMVYTDVLARPGNSGGPMVDVDGLLVGTVTLMKPPEGREDTGGAKYSSLVPAALSQEMVSNAFLLEKITPGTDVTPFMAMLTDYDGRLNIPEYSRLRDQDALFFDNGDRIFGEIATDKIIWESPIGDFEVPTSAIAYVITSEDESNLFLEGGNRISAASVDATFKFRPQGGSVSEQTFSQTAVVAFRTSDRKIKQVDGEVIILDALAFHLVLTDVKGNAKLESRAGLVDVSLADLSRIDSESDWEVRHILTFRDGRRLTGKLRDDVIDARVAATGTPIRVKLSAISRATVEVEQRGHNMVGGLNLNGVLVSAGRNIVEVARDILANNPAKARDRLKRWTGQRTLRSLPEKTRNQITLLDGLVLIGEGKYDAAEKTLRKAAKSDDVNVSAYAMASLDVLKHFDKEYDGKALSDRSVFILAGQSLADDHINHVRKLLKDKAGREVKTRGDFVRGISDARKLEGTLITAGVFNGSYADDELIRLWKYATSTSMSELRRIDTALGISRGTGRQSQRSRSNLSAPGSLTKREEKDLLDDRKKAIDALRTYQRKLDDYGFRIEDQDIHEYRGTRSGGP